MEGLAEPGEEAAGGDAEPGPVEPGVVLLHKGRGDEVVVLVELAQRPTLM
jgi:hypothetical protein